jgi:hypothetical protein
MLTESAGAMALIRESGRERDLRKRQVRCGQKVLRPPHAASYP